MRLVDRLEIRRAALVFAQSEFQKRMLKETLRVESIVIKNGLPIPRSSCEKSDPPMVLWAGSISKVKRPWLFVKLAEQIPYGNFEMIGGKTGDAELYETTKDNASKLPNLTFHGFVPYNEIDEFFKRASVFVNTSIVEGFPMTFLQAWAHCTPIVSLAADPDRIIERENLGFCAGTFEGLVSDVVAFLKDRKLREEIGRNVREYVEEAHDVKRIVKKYVEIFERLASSPKNFISFDRAS
jgi:glycosyltransferase involved in cell wall biosynthesis